jgi:hypothetical protein
MEEVSRQLVNWLKRDVVKLLRSQYTSNIFSTPKPVGTFRMAFDGRLVNRIIDIDNLATPLFSGLLSINEGIDSFLIIWRARILFATNSQY